MKNVFVLFGLLLFAGNLSGQSSYWTALNPPPGGIPEYVTQTANGWRYAVYYKNAEERFYYVSKNNGQSWTPFQLPGNATNTELIIGRAGRLFADSSDINTAAHIFSVSEDGGESWSPFNILNNMNSIDEDSLGRLYCIVYSPGGQKLVRTDNEGASWDTLFHFQQSDNAHRISINDLDNIILDSSPSVFAYSIDHGLTWKYKTCPFVLYDADRIIVTPAETVLMQDFPGILRSPLDSGLNFNTIYVDTIGNQQVGVDKIALSADGHLLCSGNGYLYQSTDDGLSWQPFGNPAKRITLLSATSFVDGTWPVSHHSTFQCTPDMGQTFSAPVEIPHGLISDLIVESPGHWLARAESHIWETYDSGQNWQARAAATTRNGFSKMLKFSTDSLLIADGDSLFFFKISTGALTNITPVNFIYRVPASVHISPANGYIFLPIFRLTPDPLITQTLISADKGQSWQMLDDVANLLDLERHPSGVLLATFQQDVNGNFIKKSTDGGLHWENVAFPSPAPLDLFIDQTGNIYCTGYKSADLGNTWTTALNVAGTFGHTVANSLNHIYYRGPLPTKLGLTIDAGASGQVLPPFDTVPVSAPYISGLALDHEEKLLVPVNNNSNTGLLFRTQYSTLQGAYLTGTVGKDADNNCNTTDQEYPLQNWIVKAGGAEIWYTNTDSTGQYRMFVDTGTYELTLRPRLNILWAVCDSSQTVSVPGILDTAVVDFNAAALADCPYMTVDVAMAALVRCFETYGAVSYCNQGTVSADTAWIDLSLDPALRLVSAELPFDSLGNGLYRFALGSVAPGQCGNFGFSVLTDCGSTELGQTLCLSAHIFPDSLCIQAPGWSGAEVRALARCVSDTAVIFEIKNLKPVGSQILDYIVVEDDVVLRQGNDTYGPNQTRTMSVSNPSGHFYRLVSEQEPGHPFSTQVAAWIEGCGGQNSMGYTNQFLLDNGIPSEDVECVEVTGSFDPNDKQGFPRGIGNQHFISANTEIEYLIRFQNTGTAPAHFVVIRDTLSPELEPATLRPGAASHPYTWKLEQQGILSIRFDPINLPDSSANEAASQGFISFRIAQKPDLPYGTLIENRAAIYFDYNGAVQTNQTWHTVSRDLLDIVSVNHGYVAPTPGIVIFPNPATDVVSIELKQGHSKNKSLQLTDALGRIVLQKTFSGGKTELYRGELPPGVYFAKIVEGRQVLGASRIVWR